VVEVVEVVLIVVHQPQVEQEDLVVEVQVEIQVLVHLGLKELLAQQTQVVEVVVLQELQVQLMVAVQE
jgi:hypothetical protein